MSTHLTIKNKNRPNPRTATPEPFTPNESSWGHYLFCGRKQERSWGAKLSGKRSVKQTKEIIM